MLHVDIAHGSTAVGQTDVGLAVADGLRDLGGRGGHQLELHARVLLPERGHGQRQKLKRKAGRCADPHLASAQALQRLDIGDDALGLQRMALGMGGQQLTGSAGHHAARAALEQRHLQHFLQRCDLAADGGRRDIQAQRGLADRAAAHDFQKIADGGVLEVLRGGHGLLCKKRNDNRKKL